MNRIENQSVAVSQSPNNSYVFAKLPRTGLGNMMLVWARAMVFAYKHGLPVITSSWTKIHWGVWLRREQKKRLYVRYFKKSKLGDQIGVQIRKLIYKVSEERHINNNLTDRTVFVFSEVSIERDLFGPIRDYRDFIAKAIIDSLHPNILSLLEKQEIPQMAVHIRRGDFKLGNPITPTSFFIDLIKYVREVLEYPVSVTVFSDAEDHEIADVLSLGSVKRALPNPDIIDILLMSKSKILVLSRSSSFSYWGAFLSDALIIKSEDDWQDDLRPQSVNAQYYEGKIRTENPESLLELGVALRRNKEYIIGKAGNN